MRVVHNKRVTIEVTVKKHNARELLRKLFAYNMLVTKTRTRAKRLIIFGSSLLVHSHVRRYIYQTFNDQNVPSAGKIGGGKITRWSIRGFLLSVYKKALVETTALALVLSTIDTRVTIINTRIRSLNGHSQLFHRDVRPAELPCLR